MCCAKIRKAKLIHVHDRLRLSVCCRSTAIPRQDPVPDWCGRLPKRRSYKFSLRFANFASQIIIQTIQYLISVRKLLPLDYRAMEAFGLALIWAFCTWLYRSALTVWRFHLIILFNIRKCQEWTGERHACRSVALLAATDVCKTLLQYFRWSSSTSWRMLRMQITYICTSTFSNEDDGRCALTLRLSMFPFWAQVGVHLCLSRKSILSLHFSFCTTSNTRWIRSRGSSDLHRYLKAKGRIRRNSREMLNRKLLN